MHSQAYPTGGLGLLVSGFGMVHQMNRLQNRAIVDGIINQLVRYCDIAPMSVILPYSSEVLVTPITGITNSAA